MKLKKLRFKAKEEEEKYNEFHKNTIEVEERCRNMNEIILFNKKKKKDLISNQANEQTIAELESDYKTLVFTKEDKLI